MERRPDVDRASAPTRAATFAFAACCLACAQELESVDDAAAPGLPVARLSCPAAVDAGAPFDVVGEAEAARPFVETSLVLSPGGASLAALSGTFVVDTAGIVTVILAVVDDAANRAEARCRIDVVGGASEGAGEPEPEPQPEPQPDAQPDEELDLSGAFAMVAWDRHALEGGALDPGMQCPAAPQLSLVELEQAGDRVTMSMRLCYLDLPPVQVAFVGVQRTSVPVAILESMPALGPVSFTIGSDGGERRLRPPLDELGAPVVVGAELESPDDALPVDAADPRVRDHDDDGDPGVSLLSTAGAQHVVYRRWLRALSGVIVSSDEIDGSAEGSYGVDDEASLLSFLSFLVPTGQGLRSTFRMTRADGRDGARDLAGDDGVLDCDDLRAHKDELVGEHPPPPAPEGCPAF